MDTKQEPLHQQGPDTDTQEGEQLASDAVYLDLDGDGVPDAVQTVEAVAVDRTGDGVPDEVEVHEELASDIGVDGVPEHVSVTERGTVEIPDVTTN